MPDELIFKSRNQERGSSEPIQDEDDDEPKYAKRDRQTNRDRNGLYVQRVGDLWIMRGVLHVKRRVRSGCLMC